MTKYHKPGKLSGLLANIIQKSQFDIWNSLRSHKQADQKSPLISIVLDIKFLSKILNFLKITLKSSQRITPVHSNVEE